MPRGEVEITLVSLRKGYLGAGRMLFSMGSKGKIKKGAGRMNLVREQGGGKQQKLEGSKKIYEKGAGRMVKKKEGSRETH